MIRSHPVHLLFVLTLLWCAGACSRSSSHETFEEAFLEVPDDMIRLLPADAVLYLHVSSMSALDGLFAEISQAMGEEVPPELDLLSGLELFGIDRDRLDAERPLGLALNLTPDGQPIPTLVLPVADPVAFVESLSTPTATRGDYVAVSMAPLNAAPEGTSTLADAMLDGTLSLRIDLKQLIEPFRPMIDSQLDLVQAQIVGTEDLELGMENMEEFFGMYMSGIRSSLDSADMFSLAVGQEGDMLRATLALDVLEGSPLADFASEAPTGLGQLAHCLRGDEPVVIMAGMDMEDHMRRFEPFTQASLQMYPETMRESMQAYMESMDSLYALFGSAFIYDMDVGEGGFFGIVFRSYFAPVDPEMILSSYESVLSGNELEVIGMSFSTPVRSEVDGVPVLSFVIEVDGSAMAQFADPDTELDAAGEMEMYKMLESMYGEEGVRLSVAQKDGRAVMVIGGDEAYLADSIARLGAEGSTLPAPLQAALEEVGESNPSMVVHLDLAHFAAMMVEITSNFLPEIEAPEVQDFEGISAPFTMYGMVTGHTWRAGLLVDMAGLAEVTKLAPR